MQEDIIAQGVELLLFGMGTVVLFLALLVLSTTLMSRFINRYFPESEPTGAAEAALQRLRGEGAPSEDPNLVAVISAAIHRHRNTRK